MRKNALALMIAMALGTVPAFAGGHGAAMAKAGPADIVETAAAAGSFNTLVAAVKAAGLVETLQSEGPFTVFAPTDEAFAKLPEGAVEKLLANPDELRTVLLYHVVPGRVMASDVAGLDHATTAEGQDLQIRLVDGSVSVNDARVTATDIETSNGVIHVIDTVLLPRS